MWPNLMGPEWQQQFLTAAALLVTIIAAGKMLASAATRCEADETPDQLLTLWRRYEEGDLTRQEFERAKGTLRALTAATVFDQAPREKVRHASAVVGEGGIYMRTIVAVLVLGAAIILNAATAFSADSTTTATRLFYGDGFDNTTCADLPRGQTCK